MRRPATPSGCADGIPTAAAHGAARVIAAHAQRRRVVAPRRQVDEHPDGRARRSPRALSEQRVDERPGNPGGCTQASSAQSPSRPRHARQDVARLAIAGRQARPTCSARRPTRGASGRCRTRRRGRAVGISAPAVSAASSSVWLPATSTRRPDRVKERDRPLPRSDGDRGAARPPRRWQRPPGTPRIGPAIPARPCAHRGSRPHSIISAGRTSGTPSAPRRARTPR